MNSLIGLVQKIKKSNFENDYVNKLNTKYKKNNSNK